MGMGGIDERLHSSGGIILGAKKFAVMVARMCVF
jgi:hypothetical protein